MLDFVKGSLRGPLGVAWTSCALAVVLAGCATPGGELPEDQPPGRSEEPLPVPMPEAPAPAPPPPAPVLPAPAPPPPVVEAPADNWVPLQAWCQTAGLTGLRQIAAAPSPTYAVNTPGGGLVLRMGSGTVFWDGIDVRLGFPPEIVEDEPCVHPLDVRKTLEPMIKKRFLSGLKSPPTIVIDPGHGGTDSGAKSVLGYGHEKDFTLDWARRLGPLLATNGWRVFLTRNADVDMPLSNRVAFAEARHADLFLSLHFNSAAPDQHQAGLETYCVTPKGMSSTITRGYEDDPGLSFPNNAFDESNLQLALLTHRALLPVNGRADRGVRRARYLRVLREQKRPAVLIEGGYLSNPREARWISTPAYRQKMAEAVARALTGS